VSNVGGSTCGERELVGRPRRAIERVLRWIRVKTNEVGGVLWFFWPLTGVLESGKSAAPCLSRSRSLQGSLAVEDVDELGASGLGRSEVSFFLTASALASCLLLTIIASSPTPPTISRPIPAGRKHKITGSPTATTDATALSAPTNMTTYSVSPAGSSYGAPQQVPTLPSWST
jgi:hypothetical protein